MVSLNVSCVQLRVLPDRALRVRARGVWWVALVALLSTIPAQAQVKKCEQLRNEIASRLLPRGSYRLEIVPMEEASDGKFLGRCEAATRKIVAFRTDGTVEPRPAGKQAEPEVAAPATPSTTVAATAPAASAAPQPAGPARSPAEPAAAREPPAAAATVAVADEPSSAAQPPATPAAAAAAQKRLSITMPERINITDDLEIKVTFDVGDQNIEARLKSSNKGVTVTPEEPVPPEDRNGQSATWTWVVTPESTGKLNLDIALMSTQANGQVSRPVTLARTVRTVVVERTLMQSISDFASKNFQWLWTAILLPVAGLYWRSQRKQSGGAGAGA